MLGTKQCTVLLVFDLNLIPFRDILHIYLMVPPGHRQTVRDGQPVPVHLEICGMTDIQSREV